METSLKDNVLTCVFGALVAGTTGAIVKSIIDKPKEAKVERKISEDEIGPGGVVDVETLWKGPKTENIRNPMLLPKDDSLAGEHRFLHVKSCIPEGAFTVCDKQYRTEADLLSAKRYLKAGPKPYLFYDPAIVKAAIVTCGGLCPGENVVIRELVMALWYGYGVREIYGVMYGYEGFWKIKNGHDCYVKLIPELPLDTKDLPKGTIAVRDIHTLGGTILGASRGGFDGDKIIDALEARHFNHVYAVGGDGTHRGLYELSKIIKKRNLQITLMGIPKTIDNDMPLIDKTFGFASAVEAAMWAIQCADTEANSAEYGVGIVKVMGRAAGHIALHASLANRDVNICLLPEFSFDVYGAKGLMEYIMKRLKERHHCVIVVAEGAAMGMRDVKLAEEVKKDASGNVIPEVYVEWNKNRILGSSSRRRS